MAPTGYIIYKKNEVAEEMYFLTKGKVHLLVEVGLPYGTTITLGKGFKCEP